MTINQSTGARKTIHEYS